MPKRKCGVVGISKCFQHSVQWYMFIAKNVFFEWMHWFCVGTKYLVLLQLLLLYTIAIL